MLASQSYNDLVKAVVDIERDVMAIGGELHSDEEGLLLQDGSLQQNLWGINIYPNVTAESMIEFDSMINIRPAQGNHSRSVEDRATQARIIRVVEKLIKE
jgi:hypothetical protein